MRYYLLKAKTKGRLCIEKNTFNLRIVIYWGQKERKKEFRLLIVRSI
jgi:hypothetical protein